MAYESEVYVVSLDQDVDVEARKAAEAMARLESGVDRARDSLGRFVAAGGRASAATAGIQASTAQLDRQWVSVSAAGRKFADGLDRSGAESRKAGRDYLTLAYAIDDLQYGLRGIANQLPQLAAMFGLPGKAAGAISTAATAVLVWQKNWQHFEEIVRGSPIEGALRDLKTAWEQVTDAAGAAAKAQAAAYDAELKKEAEGGKSGIEGIRSTAQQDAAAGFRATVETLPGGGEALRRDLVQKAIAGRPDLEIGLDFAEKPLADQEKIREGRQQVEDAIDRRFAAAMGGNLAAIGGIFDDTGNGGVLRSFFEKARPSTARRSRENERANEESDAARERAADDRREAAAEEARIHGTGADFGPDRRTLEAGLADRDRRAGELVGPLQGRFDAELLMGRPIDERQVRGELERSGVASPEAGELAGGVLRELQQAFERRVQGEALEQGISPEEAEARLGRRGKLEHRRSALERAREAMGDRLAAMGPARPSQVMDPASLVNAIQSGIGGTNPMQQMVGKMGEQIQILQRMERDLRDANRLG
jgi:hypothetical protein